MPDVRRTLSAMQAILADNTTGDITAQDVRDFLVSAYPVILNEPQGRLTTESGVSVSSTDRTSQSDVFYTPHAGNGLWLYDGTLWQPCQFSEFGIRLAGLTSGKNYDIFAFCSSAVPSSTNTGTDVLTFASATGWQTGAFVQVSDTGGGLTAGTSYFYRAVTTTTGTLHTTVAGALAGTGTVDITGSITAALRAISLELSAAWNADTPGSTQNRFASGPYSVLLPMQDGMRVKSTNGTAIDATRLYLGTIRTTSTTATEDSLTKRFVWNAHNQINRQLRKADATASWTYATANVWRSANNSTSNRVEVVCGSASAIDLEVVGLAFGNASVSGHHSIGEDSTSTPASEVLGMFGLGYSSTILSTGRAALQKNVVGCHYYQWLEGVDGSATVTFYGTESTGLPRYRTGIYGVVNG